MSFLTKHQIMYELEKGNIQVETEYPDKPFVAKEQVQEASIDLRISDKFSTFISNEITIDTREIVNNPERKKDKLIDKLFKEDTMSLVTGKELKPNEIIYTTIYEKITIPEHLAGLVVGRSWFARLGISINMSAPYCPPGIKWNFPLQIKNCSERNIIIYPFTSLAQILFSSTHGTPEPYDGLFQNSTSEKTNTGGNEIPKPKKKNSVKDFKPSKGK